MNDGILARHIPVVEAGSRDPQDKKFLLPLREIPPQNLILEGVSYTGQISYLLLAFLVKFLLSALILSSTNSSSFCQIRQNLFLMVLESRYTSNLPSPTCTCTFQFHLFIMFSADAFGAVAVAVAVDIAVVGGVGSLFPLFHLLLFGQGPVELDDLRLDFVDLAFLLKAITRQPVPTLL